jgi:hypothetical protein
MVIVLVRHTVTPSVMSVRGARIRIYVRFEGAGPGTGDDLLGLNTRLTRAPLAESLLCN